MDVKINHIITKKTLEEIDINTIIRFAKNENSE